MWPHVIRVGRAGLAVARVYYITVVNNAVAVVVKLAEIKAGIGLLGQLAGLLYHRTGVDVLAGVFRIACVCNQRLGQSVRPYHREVGHKLPH